MKFHLIASLPSSPGAYFLNFFDLADRGNTDIFLPLFQIKQEAAVLPDNSHGLRYFVLGCDSMCGICSTIFYSFPKSNAGTDAHAQNAK